MHSILSRRVFALLALLIPILICSFPQQPTGAVSSSVVISEFRTRGPNGGNDEFIELYNLSSSPVTISGWEIRGSNSSGTVSTRAIINSGAVLNPGCHYLLTNSNPTGGPYSGGAVGNQTYGVGITDDGGIALTTASGTIIDQVGMSTGSAFKEGSILSPLTSGSNQSYERRPGAGSGSGTDTDNNNSDFRLISPSDPQNASSSCLTGGSPSNPSGVGAADPSSVALLGTTLLTVRVSPGSNPTSTGISVHGNLTPIGGGASQQFFDDGTNGDATPGDHTFSYRATVGSTIPAGAKSLSITISDAQSRSATTSIAVTVQSTAPGQCGVERWSVKTGTDPDAGQVALSLVTPTTIATMRGWPKPGTIPSNNRIAPYETTVWVITATLTQYKLEEDSDYHLVLQDEAGSTIIAEVACPCCVGASSPFAHLIGSARAQFDARFTPTGSFQSANIPVQVIGVGMFDFLHGQTGVAPNGIELHPVLDIKFLTNLRTPQIVNASVSGKKLFVLGLNFDSGAKIYIADQKQKTTNDEESPTTLLIGKKAGKLIGRGQTVTLTVKNADGSVSEPFSFRRPE